MNTPQLKPCPFCGGQGRIETWKQKGAEYFVIGCETTGCLVSTFGQKEGHPATFLDRSVREWNTRVGERKDGAA